MATSEKKKNELSTSQKLQALGAALQDISTSLRGEKIVEGGSLGAFQERIDKDLERLAEQAKEAEKIAKEKSFQSTQLDSLFNTFGDDLKPESLEKYSVLRKGAMQTDTPFETFQASAGLLNKLSPEDQDTVLFSSLEEAIQETKGTGLELSTASRKKGGYDVAFARPKIDYGEMAIRKGRALAKRMMQANEPLDNIYEALLEDGIDPTDIPELQGYQPKKNFLQRMWR